MIGAELMRDAALLGAMMLDNRIVEDVQLKLRTHHFFEPLHARIYEGILRLTRFASPDPVGHFMGKRRLGTDIRDDYGRLIPPPTPVAPAAADHLDQIADCLILAHSLIEEDGGRDALPDVRKALFKIGRALAARTNERAQLN